MSSACWARGHRAGFGGKPSASAAGRSMATMTISGGGVRGPRSLKSRPRPAHSSTLTPSGSAKNNRPATALRAPTATLLASTRVKGPARGRDMWSFALLPTVGRPLADRGPGTSSGLRPGPSAGSTRRR